MSERILIIDTDAVQRRLLESLINRFGYQVELAANMEAALSRLAGVNEPRFDLFIVEQPGFAPFREFVTEAHRRTPVIVLVGAQAVETVPSLLKAGAYDFLVRPAGPERLLAALKNTLRQKVLEDEIRRLQKRGLAAASFKELIGEGFAMERVERLAQRSAKSGLPVLLEGEAGVGKQRLARAIHAASDRHAKPFVSIDCQARANIQQSEALDLLLFGADERGGELAGAQGGTLFLHEVSRLPLALQGRLYQALQAFDEVKPLGKRPVRQGLRLMASTSSNLIECVKRGEFREDLYFRLNVCPIFIPPLRLRKDDLPGLARGFAHRFAAEEGVFLRGISAEALALLNAYEWPGNLRQLENAVFRAVILAGGDELTVAEFPQIAAKVEGFDVRVPPAPVSVPRAGGLTGEHLSDPKLLRLIDEAGEILPLPKLEEAVITFALTHYQGRMSVIARRLGIGRSTLYRKLKDFSLPVPRDMQDVEERGVEDGGDSHAAA